MTVLRHLGGVGASICHSIRVAGFAIDVTTTNGDCGCLLADGDVMT